MSLFKRDGGWVIKWKDGAGRWRQQRTNSATKAEAQELERGVARKAELQRVRSTVANRKVSQQSYLMKTTISSKGQLVLPRALREKDGVKAGQEFTVSRVRAGEYRLIRSPKRNQGLVAQLLACPEKGWFVPLTSESTDTL